MSNNGNIHKSASLNLMQKPRIEKVVVNIAVGQAGEQLQKAMTIIEQITSQKPCQRLAKKTIKDWGVRKNEPIACLVTLRKKSAQRFLKKAFKSVNNKIHLSSFDKQGNFSFGINKHIDIPETKYDPKLGIFGMDVNVTMEKAGYKIKKRRGLKSIGKKQRVKTDETVKYIKETYGIEVI
jgi:large subunit ribosomal protein L5